MASPPDRFNTLLNSTSFLFVVYYRGHWCPFCNIWLKQLHSIERAIVSAHGVALIVTAEPETHLAATRANSGYTGEALVDTQNLLASDLKQRGLLDVAITEKAGYEHGMAQPAVLVMRKDGGVVYQWAIVPSLMNVGGATDRPSLVEVWENAQAQMRGEAAVHASYSTLKFWQEMKAMIFG